MPYTCCCCQWCLRMVPKMPHTCCCFQCAGYSWVEAGRWTTRDSAGTCQQTLLLRWADALRPAWHLILKATTPSDSGISCDRRCGRCCWRRRTRGWRATSSMLPETVWCVLLPKFMYITSSITTVAWAMMPGNSSLQVWQHCHAAERWAALCMPLRAECRRSHSRLHITRR